MATISQALNSLNTYPVNSTTIDVVLLDRELDGTATYTKIIGLSDNYRLATADIYMWLSSGMNLREQEVNIAPTDKDKANFLSMANAIYKELDDPKFSGSGLTYGFKGDNWNA